ncbi:MAG: hypothetical protein INR73_07065 [Williamsia sp.]|nr:hypothetical protein [Williamsia sp.]
MKLILKSFQSDAVFAAQTPGNPDTSTRQMHPDEDCGQARRSLSIPSGCCMAGKQVDPYRMAICQSAGECIQNRQLSAPTGDADFFA